MNIKKKLAKRMLDYGHYRDQKFLRNALQKQKSRGRRDYVATEPSSVVGDARRLKTDQRAIADGVVQARRLGAKTERGHVH
ncbi:hypothetical protein EVAR_67442_1 [Eumeta japonica]|uniref:Uncharacterized protein n=1 Tax=Eumeta variegata TaxID=151549 RepID=A0A4C1ZY97_EUMVA|nr:hypothetical protein EVAR_67442_1 [Eumeta japonica]